MKYIDKTEFICKTSRQIEAYELLISDYEKIIKVVEKMDGKVLNARFDKAVKESGIQGFLCNRRQWDIHKWTYSLSVHNQKVSTFEGVRTLRNGNEKRFFGYVDSDDSDFNIIVTSEKRIEAEETVKSINNSIGYIQSSIKDCQYTIEHYDEIAARTKRLMDDIDRFHSEVPYFARPYIYSQDSGPILIEE